MIKHVTVYCASSGAIHRKYFDVAQEMGRALANRGFTLVFGGGQVGLMGEMARAVHDEGGTVWGVIPETLKAREGVAYDVADELIITKTMQERKRILFTRADAFVILPGGFGTLEEFMEVLTLKQLGFHDKPITLVNTHGYYDPLVSLFEHFFEERFAHDRYRSLYHIANDQDEALDYVESYRGAEKRLTVEG